MVLFGVPSIGFASVVVQDVFRIIGRLNRDEYAIALVEPNVAAPLKIASRVHVMKSGCLTLWEFGARLLIK